MSTANIHNKINRNAGFAAIISILLLSGIFLAMVLSSQQNILQLFNLVELKEYRREATTHALVCFNKAVTELVRDYFYAINSSSDALAVAKEHCSIISVSGFSKQSTTRHIIVTGDSEGAHSTITARIDAAVLLDYQKISFISATTTF
jgi:hypothetical protein